MSKKIFIFCRIMVMLILAIIVVISVQNNEWILPVISFLASMALMFWCKKKVKFVLTDERDYKLAEKSSRLTISVFSIVGVISGIILISLGKTNYDLYLIGNTILYAICFLILLGAIFYWILNRKGE
jgi:uncharacterized membrane protein